jgi:4-hydroxy-tetrahydrodipicolinate reductase
MKVGIVGIGGRMGRMLAQATLDAGVELAGGTERSGSDHIGRDIGELMGRGVLGIRVGQDPADLFGASDVVIDFTAPAATLAHAAMAAKSGKALVIGTTGLTPDDEQALRRAAESAPIVFAPNYSLGVNLMLALVEQAARALAEEYDIEIVEMHHRHKVDSPSGTALGLGRAAAKGRAVALDQVWRKSRDGQIGARPKGEIGFATLRGGDVVGDHTVVFAAEGERFEITHKASSRAVFANGAVKAALWVAGKPPGFYSMEDVLGI